MNRRTLWSSLPVAVLALTALTGCDLSAEEVEQGAEEVQQGAEEVQQGAEEGLEQVEQGLEDARGGDGGGGNG
ncbi:hypothetical protein [Kocuria sabuli]|uniref:hypothetical protein n=1 Tax=Kocuria sabuli TaxID=3071448 RepID=UPI0034D6BB8E